MAIKLTIKEVLGKAIQKEIESQHLYRELGQRMTDKAAKEAFQELVRQEQEHQQLLEKYLRGELQGGTLSSEQIIDYKIAEHFKRPEISFSMELKDVFLFAANREKASHEFYLNLARIHPPGEVKRLVRRLARQELEHKQRVEFLYTEVAFPQTDGG